MPLRGLLFCRLNTSKSNWLSSWRKGSKPFLVNTLSSPSLRPRWKSILMGSITDWRLRIRTMNWPSQQSTSTQSPTRLKYWSSGESSNFLALGKPSQSKLIQTFNLPWSMWRRNSALLLITRLSSCLDSNKTKFMDTKLCFSLQLMFGTSFKSL